MANVTATSNIFYMVGVPGANATDGAFVLRWDREPRLFVVFSSNHAVAFGVERVAGTELTVIDSLDELSYAAQHVRAFMGATVFTETVVPPEAFDAALTLAIIKALVS